jgi:hypothetical protein
VAEKKENFAKWTVAICGRTDSVFCVRVLVLESECNWEYLLELLSFLFSSNFSISTSSLSSLVSRAVLKRNQAHQAKKTLDVSDMVTVQ